ncbi:MAG: hypothetical protein QXE01_08975 [Sulfolobales archaeon]
MKDIDRSLLFILGIELYILQFLVELDIYRPLTAILTIALLSIPIATLEGVGGGVARALSIVLGLELIAMGFLFPGITVYSLAIGASIITIVGMLSIANTREGAPRWISLATLSLIYILLLVVVHEPTEMAIIVGMLGAFLGGGFIALTLKREWEEIE